MARGYSRLRSGSSLGLKWDAASDWDWSEKWYFHPSDLSWRDPVITSREVEPIRKRLSGLAARRAGFVLGLQASAGMGKTFTVLEVLKGASCRTVSVRAVAPVSKLIQTLPRPKRLAVWVERELEKPEPSSEAIMALLLGLAPLVIHVEDLHECTTAQLEGWQALARGITQSRGLALIATSRITLPEPFETVVLEPLSSAASTQLLEHEVGAILPAEATAWIHARAAGNPLFTLEFFRSLTRRGFVWSDGSRWHWRVPDRDVLPVTVEAMIERTINEACTDDSTRVALEARAYLEHLEPNLKLEQEVWAQVAGLELDVVELAERNLRAGGVLGDSGFVHPLFREVPIKNISSLVRESFARHALEVLPLEIGALFIEDAQLGAKRSLELLQHQKRRGVGWPWRSNSQAVRIGLVWRSRRRDSWRNLTCGSPKNCFDSRSRTILILP
jgi:hypothetical protein